MDIRSSLVTARLFFLLAAIPWSLPAGAQTASGPVQGQVLDLKSGAPVRFATVMLRGPFSQRLLVPLLDPTPAAVVEVAADEQGRSVFRNLAPGNYAIRV